jgi:hypothetical protein
MAAVAVFVGSTTLAAVIVTVCRLVIMAGAAYTPFTTLPTGGLSDQFTATLPVPVREAANVADPPPPRETEVGPTDTPIGIRETVALAIWVESATLVAVTVTVCGLAIIGGA